MNFETIVVLLIIMLVICAAVEAVKFLVDEHLNFKRNTDKDVLK